MPLVIFLGLSYAYETKAMPRLDFLVVRLGRRWRMVLYALLSTIHVTILAVLVWYTFEAALLSTSIGETRTIGASSWPLYPILYLAPLGLATVALHVVSTAILSFRRAHPHLSLREGLVAPNSS